MAKPHTVVAYVDGGCHDNGGPRSQAYGSYQIGEAVPVRFDLPGASTNNQAEYGALLQLLAALRTERCPITVYMDSQLVVNQFWGHWRINDARLRQLREQAVAHCEDLLTVDFRLLWVEREVIVARLGH